MIQGVGVTVLARIIDSIRHGAWSGLDLAPRRQAGRTLEPRPSRVQGGAPAVRVVHPPGSRVDPGGDPPPCTVHPTPHKEWTMEAAAFTLNSKHCDCKLGPSQAVETWQKREWQAANLEVVPEYGIAFFSKHMDD